MLGRIAAGLLMAAFLALAFAKVIHEIWHPQPIVYAGSPVLERLEDAGKIPSGIVIERR